MFGSKSHQIIKPSRYPNKKRHALELFLSFMKRIFNDRFSIAFGVEGDLTRTNLPKTSQRGLATSPLQARYIDGIPELAPACTAHGRNDRGWPGVQMKFGQRCTKLYVMCVCACSDPYKYICNCIYKFNSLRTGEIKLFVSCCDVFLGHIEI